MTDLLAELAPWLIVGCSSLLCGATLGYYTASRDYERIHP